MGLFSGRYDIDPTEDVKPLLVLHANGGVSLDLDGEVTLHFPSLPAYDAWQETVDRSRAALGQPRRGYAEVAEYQARVRDLREQRREHNHRTAVQIIAADRRGDSA